MLHDALLLGGDISLILKACGAGLRSWQNPFDDFQVTLPFVKDPSEFCTLQSIRQIWIDSDMERRTQYEAAQVPPALDKDDQDDADWDIAVGWNHGTDVLKAVYEERLQLVRSVR